MLGIESQRWKNQADRGLRYPSEARQDETSADRRESKEPAGPFTLGKRTRTRESSQKDYGRPKKLPKQGHSASEFGKERRE